MFAKILRCRGAGENEECEVQYYRGDDEESTPRWENADLLRLADERVQSHKQHDAPQPAEANTIAPEPHVPQAMHADQAGSCSYTVPAGDAGRTAKPSEQLFKRKIYDNYNIAWGRIQDVTNEKFEMRNGKFVFCSDAR